jgi:hypothetical protein
VGGEPPATGPRCRQARSKDSALDSGSLRVKKKIKKRKEQKKKNKQVKKKREERK